MKVHESFPENMSIALRKKIYEHCIARNKTMISVAVMLNIPAEEVREYVYLLFSDEKERARVAPQNAKLYPPKPTLTTRFTGYYSELTEDDMILGPDYVYDRSLIREESDIPYIDRRSFSERLKDLEEWLPKKNK